MIQTSTDSRDVRDVRTPVGLLVDDRPGQLLGCKKLLTILGAEVDTATNIEDAEDLVNTRYYQFALIDFVIGRSSSNTKGLVRLLRKRSPWCKIYILTAYPRDASEALSEIGVPILEKPVSGERLRTILPSFHPDRDVPQA